ncbi:TonB-dependent receptor [Draconibacterium sediminis]|uniref:TonB-dependent receptor n=1 Tax=Draconibacterium sediminis TaxID=1544798 RepID=A0A0D8JCZ4_9BACT|nr:TonB-dependent receptor [Draconibacterium sediminis]KJF43673.1 TonB-dependent receptor [Draconibacterium sediminis]
MKSHIFLLTLLMSSLSSFSQGTLSGTVTDRNNHPVAGATVHLEALQTGTLTQSDGSYELSSLKEGNWKVAFRMVGLQTAVYRVQIQSGETTELNVVLQDEFSKLDEIVVSASRNSEYISEIPASITVIDVKQLSNFSKSTSNINEILQFSVPGLALGSGTFSNWGQTMRGRSLLVMVDGIPQSTPLRNGLLGIKSVNPNDINRVEVIKGATSIFGNGGNGGFINYITKNGTSEKTIEGTTNLWGASNLAKTKDAQGWGVYQSLKGQISQLSYYLSGSFERTGNQYDADGVPLLPTYGMDNTDIYSTFAKVSYQLSENQKLTLNGNFYETAQKTPFIPELAQVQVLNADGDYILTPGYGKEGSVPGQEPTGTRLTNARLKYDVDNLFMGTTHFETDLYYQKTKNIFFYSESFQNGGQSVINAEKYGIRPNFNTQITTEKRIGITLTYGVDILRDETNQGLLDGRLWVPNIEMVSWAPYLQSTFNLHDNWVLKAGFRYDDMQMNIDDYSTLPYSPKADGNFTSSVDVDGGKLTFSNVSWNFGMRYIKYDEFTPYISYSQGFSIADLGVILRSAVTSDINDINLKAAVTDNFEFGFMSKFRNIRIEAVGYYSQSNLGTGVVFSDEANAFVPSKQPQDIFGGEVSVDAILFENKLLAGTSYSYVEGFKHSTTNKNDISYLGGDVIAPAKLTAYITWKPISKMSTTLRMIHQSKRERFNPYQDINSNWTFRHTEFPVSNFTILNFAMDYEVRPNLSLSLGINNLLNEYYLSARSEWAAPLRTFTGVAEGINTRLGLNYSF